MDYEIIEVLIEVKDDKSGEVSDQWIKVKNCKFVPGYDDYYAILTRKIILPENSTSKFKSDILQGKAHNDGTIYIESIREIVKKVKEKTIGIIDISHGGIL